MELETFGDRGVYDLTRPKGMSDHDYARGLLKQSQKRRDDRKARVAAGTIRTLCRFHPLKKKTTPKSSLTG